MKTLLSIFILLIGCSVALSLSGCGKKSAAPPQFVGEEKFTPTRPEWANKKDFFDGKFEGVKIGYEQAISDADERTPLDVPFFMKAAWQNHGAHGDELSWKAGFVQGLHEGFAEGEIEREKQLTWE